MEAIIVKTSHFSIGSVNVKEIIHSGTKFPIGEVREVIPFFYALALKFLGATFITGYALDYSSPEELINNTSAEKYLNILSEILTKIEFVSNKNIESIAPYGCNGSNIKQLIDRLPIGCAADDLTSYYSGKSDYTDEDSIVNLSISGYMYAECGLPIEDISYSAKTLYDYIVEQAKNVLDGKQADDCVEKAVIRAIASVVYTDGIIVPLAIYDTNIGAIIKYTIAELNSKKVKSGYYYQIIDAMSYAHSIADEICNASKWIDNSVKLIKELISLIPSINLTDIDFYVRPMTDKAEEIVDKYISSIQDTSPEKAAYILSHKKEFVSAERYFRPEFVVNVNAKIIGDVIKYGELQLSKQGTDWCGLTKSIDSIESVYVNSYSYLPFSCQSGGNTLPFITVAIPTYADVGVQLPE